MKLYVKETKRKTVDDEKLVTVEVYKSKVDNPSYIIFEDK